MNNNKLLIAKTKSNKTIVCQKDYPLDCYQQEFTKYAYEYQNLADHEWQTVINWMKPYVTKAKKHFGKNLLLLAHYYMGGDIVRIIEYFDGLIGDSYQLSLMAMKNKDAKIIVESAVHFMAEAIAIMANHDQKVYITNPKAGCTMEMHAKDYMIEPALEQLNERYNQQNIMPICYMNTSGRVKAMTGMQGGATCTSSNVKKVFQWALANSNEKTKILFVPDQHMGENVAKWLNIPNDKIVYWPSGNAGLNFNLQTQNKEILEKFDKAKLILFSSFCSVHSFMKLEMVAYWQQAGYNVVVHPECRYEVVEAANACGSTAFIWEYVSKNHANNKKYAIGTENHMVKNMRFQLAKQGFEIVHLADAKLTNNQGGMGCGCATMSRNDPPHLVATLDLLYQGKFLDSNLIYAGDVVNEFTGTRQRLNIMEREELIANAKLAMQRMVDITENY